MRRRSGVAMLGLLMALPAAAAVSATEVQLHQFDDGPPMGPNHAFGQGDAVWVSFRVAGYGRTTGDHPRLKVAWSVEAFDPQGVPVVEKKTGAVDSELTEQDKNWLPKVRHDFVLPPLADPGTYKVVIKLEDEIGKSSITREAPFRVNAPDVAPSATLVIRNFRFLRGEEDGAGLRTPAYRQGDAVWARFEMTGYKLGPGNEFAVTYGLEVARGEEKVYAEPNAAREADKSFYRRRYSPGVLNLQLQKDTTKGEYTILLRVRDELGKQVSETKHTFTVE